MMYTKLMSEKLMAYLYFLLSVKLNVSDKKTHTQNEKGTHKYFY